MTAERALGISGFYFLLKRAMCYHMCYLYEINLVTELSVILIILNNKYHSIN